MKLVCIKDCIFKGVPFTKNKIYRAELDTKYDISIIIYVEDNHQVNLQMENPFQKTIFHKYFVTLQEYRKLKLEKINEKSSM